MGYTHYFTPKTVTDDKWKEFVDTCKKLHKNLPSKTDTAGGYFEDDDLVICGGQGRDEPKFDLDGIWFNGNESKNLDHETFSIERERHNWNFCKTARKPYDLLVVACLIAANEILGYDVSSDGEWEEWKAGIKLYMETIYSDGPDKDGMKCILPEFIFNDEDGTKYDNFENKYNIMDYIDSLFVVK